jgi:uncharacterized protein YndB with AHSA1/START domain
MSTFTIEQFIQAPVAEVWDALANIGEISQWHPGLEASHLTGEASAGLNAGRYCDFGGVNFADEKVVEWQEGERLTMRVVDTNLPLESADIRFILREKNGGTQVRLSPEYKFKYGFLGSILDRVYGRKTYQKGMGIFLRGLKTHLESGS